MKNIIIFCLLFAGLFLAAPPIYAEQLAKEVLDDKETLDLIKASPAPSDMPGISAVYLLMEEKDAVNADGTATYAIHIIWKILDKQAIPSGEVSIPFNSQESYLEINLARTIAADNTVVNVAKDNIREVTPYSSFPLYSNLKLKQFSMPAMEVGCTVEYKATLKVFKPVMTGFFHSYWSFPAGLPVRLSTFEVDIPETMEGRYLARNIDVKPDISAKAGRKTYSWKARNVFIEGIFEPFLPPYDEVCPNLIFVAHKSWNDISKWFYNMAYPQLASSAQMRDFVAGLINKNGGDREKIMKELYNFVSQDIRYVAMPLKSSDYQPHKVSDIYRDKYGDCKDKSALLVSLYALAGIEANFALLRTRSEGSIDMEFPSIDFTHCIVAVPETEDSYTLLDPTLELNRFGYVPSNLWGVFVFIVKKDGYEFAKAPIQTIETSGTSMEMEMRIRGDYVIGVSEKDEFFGDSELVMRLNDKYSTPGATKAYIESVLQSAYTKPRLIDYEFSNPANLEEHFSMKLRYEAADHIMEAGNLLLLDVPNPLALNINNAVTTEKRIYPIWFPSMTRQTSAITIMIPLGCKINYLPPSVEKDSPFGYYRRESSSDVDKITLKYYYRSKMLDIPASRYQEFKTFVNDVVKSVKESIVLEKEKPAEEKF